MRTMAAMSAVVSLVFVSSTIGGHVNTPVLGVG